MIENYLYRTEFESYEDFKQNYRVKIPSRFNFAYDIVDGWARLDKDKPALVWCDDDGNEARFTFAGLSESSNKTANYFASIGIGKGDAVMLILKQRYEVWFCMLALHKLGAICIPATYQLTTKDIIYRNNIADVKMIVAVDDPDIISNIKGAIPQSRSLKTVSVVGGADVVPIAAGQVEWHDFRSRVDEQSAEFVRPTGEKAHALTDPMLIYFSSGTTGMPKMVMHDFSYPIGHIVTAKYWQRVQEGGLHLTASDSGWAKFGWGKIYGQWICGAVILAYDTEKFVPQKMLGVIEKYKLTTFCAPPTIYRFFIKEDLTKYDFSTIRHCTTAGEPLNPEVYYQFKKSTGLAITEGFGQSETTVLIANFEWFDVKPGSMGKPSPLYETDLIDEHGHSSEDGIDGSIVVKNTDKAHPAGLFKCYYNNPQATVRAIVNGTYNTGDMAWRDEDGYYWFIGRNDDVIKCSGYRIGPFEVESALLEHPLVLECAVTSVPDPIRGQIVKATIVLVPGNTGSDELIKKLQNHVKNVTAPYKYPRIIEFVDALPKTVSGKIRRKEIRENDTAHGGSVSRPL